MSTQTVEVRAFGDFMPSEDLAIFIGDYLERTVGVFDAIVTASLVGGTLEVSVAVEAATAAEAAGRVKAALGDALKEFGLVDRWVNAQPRAAVIA